MKDANRNYQPSAGAVHGFVGATLLVLGWLGLANTSENPAFGAIGALLLAWGLYVTVAGAVARGIQLARR